MMGSILDNDFCGQGAKTTLSNLFDNMTFPWSPTDRFQLFDELAVCVVLMTSQI